MALMRVKILKKVINNKVCIPIYVLMVHPVKEKHPCFHINFNILTEEP